MRSHVVEKHAFFQVSPIDTCILFRLAGFQNLRVKFSAEPKEINYPKLSEIVEIDLSTSRGTGQSIRSTCMKWKRVLAFADVSL